LSLMGFRVKREMMVAGVRTRGTYETFCKLDWRDLGRRKLQTLYASYVIFYASYAIGVAF